MSFLSRLMTAALGALLALAASGLVRGNLAVAAPIGPSTDVVFIATGDNFPDALGAAAAAGALLAPVLLVQKEAIPAPTLTELNRLTPPRIFIVGGTGVISDGVKTALEGLAWGPAVVRLSGNNRYATAAAVSAELFPTQGLYPLAVHASGDLAESVAAAEVVRSVSLTAPADGTIIATSTAAANEDTEGDQVRCGIGTGSIVEAAFRQEWESGGAGDGDLGMLAGTRGFDVTAGQSITINLVCLHNGTSGTSVILDAALSAIFVADL